MKRIFKFIPVALTAITLSSCSSDDLFSSLGFDSNSPRTLEVTVEQLNDGDITRAANIGDGNTLIWQNGDVVTVYDDKLFLYDPYTFNGTSFVIADDKHIVETPQFALFPNAYFGEGSTFYSRNDDKVYAKAHIPASLAYGKDYSAGETEGSPYVTSNGKAAYVSLLPMWGTASVTEGKTGVSLKYMTAILKVTLTNAMGNVQYLYVEGTKDIAGTQPAQLNGEFKVDLSSTGRTPLASTTMVPTKANPVAADSKLEVDLRNINKATSIIYVPIPAGHYGLLRVWAGAQNDPYNAATNKIYEFVDKDFDVKFYGSLTKKTYAVDGTSIGKINNLLIANRDETNDELTLDCSAATTNVPADATITLPNMAAGSVELKLHSFTGGGDVTFAGSEFSKKIIINMTAATNAQAITVDLPNADVVIAGQYNDKDITVLNAKTLTFGKGTNTANATKKLGAIDIKAEVKGVVTVAKDANIKKSDASLGTIELAENHRSTGVDIKAGGTAGNITVNASATVNATAVTVAGTAGDISTPNDASTVEVSGTANDITVRGTGAVTISGKVNDITMSNVNAGALEISGKPNYAATPVAYAKAGTVNVKGNVTVSLSNEGAAIGTSLTMVAGKTLTLTQGYIKTITVPNSGSNVTIALGNDTNYKNLIIGAGSKYAVSGTTKWNGEVIGGSIDTTPEQTAAGVAPGDVATITGAWEAYKDAATAVYTATGLAMNKSAFTLKNNINLNNQAWTPVATTGDVDGSGKTISNLKVAVPANGAAAGAATAGLGLFSDLKNNVTNLTLDGVTIDATKYTTATVDYVVDNIGALAGVVSVADKTIKAVTVKNVNLSSTGGAKNIGGVIGTNTAATTLKGVKLQGTNSIQGYYQMGGLVGYAGERVTISTKPAATAPVTAADVVCAATASFAANYNSATTTPALDKNYLSVGNFIGAADKTKVFDITCAAADVNATKTVDLSIFPGYTKHNVGVNFYDYIFGQTLIGWSGDANFTTAVKINTKNYQRYGDKATWDNATEYLYYINM